jgi:phage terminase large subunit-like protein
VSAPSDEIPCVYLLASQPDGWWESLPLGVRAALLYRLDPWSRPEQLIPDNLPPGGTFGFAGGRGWGKSRSIAQWINARVMAGLESAVALAAPTDDRVREVQIKALIDYAEPWQRPKQHGSPVGLVWPNGVRAVPYSSEAPERGRGDNNSLAWCTEIVAWKPGPRLDFFKNLCTATRKGDGRVLWDSTSKGRNEVRALLEAWHRDDPHTHRIVRGTTFDNGLYPTEYYRREWRNYSGVRREEELRGAVFEESAGALWKQEWLDRTRVSAAPELEQIVVTVDPATSTHDSADETGICIGGRGRGDTHAYTLEDVSGTHRPEEWGDIAVRHADPRKPGARRGRIGIERKKVGDLAAAVIKSRAESEGLRVRLIGEKEPWPPFDPTCIFVREYSPQDSKGARAESPATETDAGRVHLVDPAYPEAPRFADLEKECTTFVPGETAKSPNRLDAFAYLVIELRELRLDSPQDHSRDVLVASQMQTALDERLRRRAPATPGVVSGLGGAVRGGGRRLGF